MFIVNVNWDGIKTTTSFFTYEYALKELNFLSGESEKFYNNGLIKKYSVELKKES